MRRRGKFGAAEKHDANQPHAPRWTRCFYLAILHLAVDQFCAFIFGPNRQRALAYELSVPLWPGRRDDWCMAERRRTSKESQSQSAEKHPQRGVFPDDLYDYALPPTRRVGRPPKHDLSTWTVTDDWPTRVPVSVQEVDVFEAWFGDIPDDLFGPGR